MQRQQVNHQPSGGGGAKSNNNPPQNRYAHLVTNNSVKTVNSVTETTSAKPTHTATIISDGQSQRKQDTPSYYQAQQRKQQPPAASTCPAAACKKPPPLGGGGGKPTNANYYASFSSVDWREQWIIMKERILEKVDEPQSQRKLILFIVCCALLLDNMLYMVIVPIIPDYLRSIGAWSTYAENAKWVRLNRTEHGGGPKWERVGGQVVYEGEDSAVGFLFASKAIVQLFINPFSGAIIDRIGYEIPMMIGLTVMFFSTMVFACGQTYTILFLARSLQGVGSAFADTSGLAMIADRFTEENERQRALGIALAFISFGCLVAPPFGSVLYEAAGKEVPFIILSLVCLLDGSLLLLVTPPGTFNQLLPAGMCSQPPPPQVDHSYKQPHTQLDMESPAQQQQTGGAGNGKDAAERRKAMQRHKSISRRQSMTTASAGAAPKGTPIYVLFRDPCIACCAGALVVANVSLAFLEPTISIWVQNTMPDIEEWQMGMIWLPAFVPHVLGVYSTVKLADKYPRYQWLIAAIGLVLEGLSCLMVPFCTSFWSLIIPISIICFGLALIDTAILPTLGFLVDSRYVSVYGSIYAIADISYSLSYAIGPVIAGGIVEAIGFTALNFLIAIVTLGYTPILMMLRSIHDYEQLDPDPAGAKREQAKELTPFGSFGRQPIREEEEGDEEGECGDDGFVNGTAPHTGGYGGVELDEAAAETTAYRQSSGAAGECNQESLVSTKYNSPKWAAQARSRKAPADSQPAPATADTGDERRCRSAGAAPHSTSGQVDSSGASKRRSVKICVVPSVRGAMEGAPHDGEHFPEHRDVGQYDGSEFATVDDWSAADPPPPPPLERSYQQPEVGRNPFSD